VDEDVEKPYVKYNLQSEAIKRPYGMVLIAKEYETLHPSFAIHRAFQMIATMAIVLIILVF
jgi:hypothetical protein